jgi:hypothetical protein
MDHLVSRDSLDSNTIQPPLSKIRPLQMNATSVCVANRTSKATTLLGRVLTLELEERHQSTLLPLVTLETY